MVNEFYGKSHRRVGIFSLSIHNLTMKATINVLFRIYSVLLFRAKFMCNEGVRDSFSDLKRLFMLIASKQHFLDYFIIAVYLFCLLLFLNSLYILVYNVSTHYLTNYRVIKSASNNTTIQIILLFFQSSYIFILFYLIY